MQYCIYHCMCDLGPGLHSGPTRHVGTHGRVGPQSEVFIVVTEALPASAATKVPLCCHTQGECLHLCVQCGLWVAPQSLVLSPLLSFTPLFFYILCIPCKTHTWVVVENRKREAHFACLLCWLLTMSTRLSLSCVCVLFGCLVYGGGSRLFGSQLQAHKRTVAKGGSLIRVSTSCSRPFLSIHL